MIAKKEEDMQLLQTRAISYSPGYIIQARDLSSINTWSVSSHDLAVLHNDDRALQYNISCHDIIQHIITIKGDSALISLCCQILIQGLVIKALSATVGKE